MNTDSKSMAISPMPHAAARERHALPGDWVRPFGDKVTALQRRRRDSEAARRAANDARLGGVALANAQSTVAFHLVPVPAGLLIERVQHRPAGTVLCQSMLLRDQRQFEAWCAVEPLRLDEPVVWTRLRRAGDGAFDDRS